MAPRVALAQVGLVAQEAAVDGQSILQLEGSGAVAVALVAAVIRVVGALGHPDLADAVAGTALGQGERILQRRQGVGPTGAGAASRVVHVEPRRAARRADDLRLVGAHVHRAVEDARVAIVVFRIGYSGVQPGVDGR